MDNYDITYVQFPSPSHDTTSAIQDFNVPEGVQGSAIANRFKFKGTPTSPIKFDSPNRSSYDDDKIFNPHSDSSIEIGYPNAPEVQTPSNGFFLEQYILFCEKEKPPPETLNQFFGYLKFKKPTPETLSVSKITTIHFTKNFNSLKEGIIKEIDNIERQILGYEDRFNRKPPYILETFNQFSPTEKQSIIDYFQLYTKLHCLLSTISINKQVLSLEESYLRNDIKSEAQKLFNSKQSITSMKKYTRFVELQEQLRKKKSESRQDDNRGKYSFLKSHLSYTVLKIKKGEGTIKLADYLSNRKPFVPKNLYEAHFIAANMYRFKEFEYEVNEISNFFPFVQTEGLNLSITVVKDPEYHFDVIFHIQSSYPWCKIEARTNVLVGNPREIDSEIQQICGNVSFCRKPILEICTKIAQNYLDLKI